MFNRKTTFIVGAGASKEFGLPIGNELKTQIARAMPTDVNPLGRFESPSIDLAYCIDRLANADASDHMARSRYLKASMSIAQSMPLSASINNYLNTHQNDMSIQAVGKLAIATCILEAEKTSSIMQRTADGLLEFSSLANTWITPLQQLMFEGVRKENAIRATSNVSFIVFNYDRCLEFCLLNAFRRYFSLELAEAVEIVSRIPIVHPYGQVGNLPWQGTADIADIGVTNRQTVAQGAALIKTFSERVEDTAKLAQMRSFLANAETIVFLGFSFGQQNMELLAHRRENSSPLNVYFSTFGLSSHAIGVSRDRIERSIIDLGAHCIYNDYGLKCADLFWTYNYSM